MITTVTLNASIDKAYHMEKKIENGTVMRVASCHNTAGGKGINVARVIKLCGEDVLATGLVGGFNGKYLQKMLKEDEIQQNFILVNGETRSCINILDPAYSSTEYLEPGCEISKEEEENFIQKFPEIIKDSQVITISGSIPKGLGKDIYKRIIELAKKMGKQVILDTSGETLKLGLEAKPTMVKPNKDEMEALFGIEIHEIDDVIEGAKRLYQMGIENVVISLGGDGALLVCEDGIFTGKPPKVEVVNTVGCGDSMVAAFAVGMVRKYEKKECLKYAVAVATANALSDSTGNFDPRVRDEIYENVIVEKIAEI